MEKKILIVDDDADDRELFCEALGEVAPGSICYGLPNARRAQGAGALCFFSKPSNFKELKQVLALIAEHLHAGSLASLVHSSPLFLTTSLNR